MTLSDSSMFDPLWELEMCPVPDCAALSAHHTGQCEIEK